MKSLLVYPYNIEASPLLRHCEMLKDYQIIYPVIDDTGDISCVDASYFDGGSDIGVKIYTSFDEAFNLCDDVLFMSEPTIKYNGLLYYSSAIASGKTVISTARFLDFIGERGEGCKILDFPKYAIEINEESRLIDIDVPVVVVMGLGCNCNKFDIQLGLRKHFMSFEYNISQIGTKEYCELFGFHALPIFQDVELWKKVILYNRYINRVVKNENPDLLIVGIPGGIGVINEYEYNLFGETAIAISRAVDVDIGILSMYKSDNIEPYVFEQLKKYIGYTLGIHVDYFHESNIQLNINQGEKRLSYIATSDHTILNECGNKMNTLFYIHDSDSCLKAYDNIIAELQENIATLLF